MSPPCIVVSSCLSSVVARAQPKFDPPLPPPLQTYILLLFSPVALSFAVLRVLAVLGLLLLLLLLPFLLLAPRCSRGQIPFPLRRRPGLPQQPSRQKQRYWYRARPDWLGFGFPGRMSAVFLRSRDKPKVGNVTAGTSWTKRKGQPAAGVKIVRARMVFEAKCKRTWCDSLYRKVFSHFHLTTCTFYLCLCLFFKSLLSRHKIGGTTPLSWAVLPLHGGTAVFCLVFYFPSVSTG